MELPQLNRVYRQLVESPLVGFWHADTQGRTVFINRRLAEMIGYSQKDVSGMSMVEFIAPELRSWLAERMKERMAGRLLPDVVEAEMIRKDGSRYTALVAPSALLDEDGNFSGFIGGMIDITDRKQAEAALRRSYDEFDRKVEERTAELLRATHRLKLEIEERKNIEEALRKSEDKYRKILEGIEDGYYEVDLAGNFTLFNDAFIKIMGYPGEELLGMNYREYMAPETAKGLYHIFNQVYRTGIPVETYEWEIIRKDGTRKYVESSISLITDSGGQPAGFRGIGRDMTEKKQMEDELIRAKNFLEEIFDSSVDGITTTDIHGTTLYTSPRVKNILGYEQEERIGHKSYELYAHGIQDARFIMRELKEKGALRSHEMKFIHKNGSLIDVNLSASFLRNKDGEVIGILGIYRDITERKKLEQQLQHALRMETIGTLAGGIAHNFNNLLTGILGNASLALMDVDPAHPNHEKLRAIENLVQSGVKLTRQLLGYARKGRYEVAPLNLNQLLKETSEMFTRTRRGITIQRDLTETLWSIEADQGQIEQVLLNLYVNAADAMPGGGTLILETKNVTHEDMTGRIFNPRPGRYTLLTVTDTGIGMDKKTQEHIFEPFFTTKEMGRGTGLGLASVYGIIKGHGGYIEVDSTKGQGTTFSIYLPASEKEAKKDKIAAEDIIIPGTETILLIDDEVMVIKVTEKLLKKLGYKVLAAKSGEEAIKIYQEHRDEISLVILDMVMPGMGGGETYDILKRADPDVKVLLSSGYSIDGEAGKILKRGCKGFIQKPFRLMDLSQKIREILER